jgi:DNA (cytosine-5)-methyltransferase 1
MSTLDVVAEVLREVAPRALCAREIAERAGGRLPTASRTPQTVVSRDLAIDVRDHGAASRFLRVDRGEFVLKEALPTAFFNDVDPYVAKWTRNLIEAGHLAPGVVDERSIRDLKPADVAGYRQCHFFAGLGTWSRVLRDAGWPDDAAVWSGSCPCQDFSSAGRRRGFDGDLHLWPEWFRLIAACRPPVVVGEQVASKAGRAWLDLVLANLEGVGYACRAFDLPAAGVGGPHARQRLYFAAYARERGREILGASWLHDRGQLGDDLARCREADGGVPGAVPDAERIVRDARRLGGPHGRSEIEPDRHGEADGGPDGLGDAGLARGRRHAGEVSRAQEVGEGERIEARDLADEPLASGAVDGGASSAGGEGFAPGEVGLVRGAAAVAGDSVGSGSVVFKPGDRIRLSDDPTWGGAVRGYWAEDVEWIYCRPEPGHQDGRWRPARACVEPLVNWPPPGVGRTRAKRLRAYGNAIVRPLAVAFVAAVIDSFADAAAQESAVVAQEKIVPADAAYAENAE